MRFVAPSDRRQPSQTADLQGESVELFVEGDECHAGSHGIVAVDWPPINTIENQSKRLNIEGTHQKNGDIPIFKLKPTIPNI